MTHPIKGFKQRLKKPAHWSIPPPVGGQTRAPEPYAESDMSDNLWDAPKKGETPTILSLSDDVYNALKDPRSFDPRRSLRRLRQRLKRYEDQGPDINRPVPRTQRRYQDD